jgi:protein tyrosine/serine phosphatase
MGFHNDGLAETLMPLNNFGVVLADKLYRSAQPDAEGFRTAFGLGVDIIHQLNGAGDDEYWRPPSLLRCKEMRTFSGFQDDAIEAENNIAIDLKLGRRTLVHCTHGRDRTGVVIAAWRILHLGWDFEHANAERLLYGNQVVLEIVDHEMVEFLQGLVPCLG